VFCYLEIRFLNVTQAIKHVGHTQSFETSFGVAQAFPRENDDGDFFRIHIVRVEQADIVTGFFILTVFRLKFPVSPDA